MQVFVTLGILAVVFLATRKSEASNTIHGRIDYNPEDPIGSWGTAVSTSLPPGDSGGDDTDFWTEFMRRKGHLQPEVSKLTPEERKEIETAILGRSDGADLLLMSEELEAQGFPLLGIEVRKIAFDRILPYSDTP